MMQKTSEEQHELFAMFLSLSSEEAVCSFLDAILTPKEFLEITQRLQIIKRLKAGQPQRLIAQELGVGIATVTRGSRELQNGKFLNV